MTLDARIGLRLGTLDLQVDLVDAVGTGVLGRGDVDVVGH